MTTQSLILNALHRAFPDPQGGIAQYLNAYAAMLAERQGNRRAIIQPAWDGMTPEEREAVEKVLDSISTQVV
jgi:hypothetical protein